MEPDSSPASASWPEVEEQLLRSESLHRILTADLPDMSMFLLDRDLRVLVAEGEGVRQLPWIDESMFRGRLVADLHGELPSEVLAASLENYRRALDGERREFEFTSAGLTFAVTAVPVRGQDGTVESALAVVRDVTQRKNAERQQECVARLGQSALRERDLRALLKQVVASVSRTLDLDLCTVLALRGEEEVLDRVASVGFREVSSQPTEIANEPSTHPGYVLRASEPVILDDLSTETRFDRAPLLLEHGVVSGISVVIDGRRRPFGVLSAYTDRHRSFGIADVNFLTAVSNVVSAAVDPLDEEETSRHAAVHDPLTGLPNRTLALDRIEHALGRRRRDGTNVAVLVFDLDRFKVINDSLGHAAGDELLLVLAPRLRDILRSNDTVARLIGDEFVIVCEAARDVREVISVADRIAAAIGRPFVLDSGEHFMTASIGVSVAAHSHDTSESLMRDAGAAMYRAKKRGPGRDGLLADRVSPLTERSTLGYCAVESGLGMVTVGAKTKLQGRRVVVLVDHGNVPGSTPSRLYIATGRASLPLLITQTGRKKAGGLPDPACGDGSNSSSTNLGRLAFSRYDRPLHITAPSHAIGLGQLAAALRAATR